MIHIEDFKTEEVEETVWICSGCKDECRLITKNKDDAVLNCPFICDLEKFGRGGANWDIDQTGVGSPSTKSSGE